MNTPLIKLKSKENLVYPPDDITDILHGRKIMRHDVLNNFGESKVSLFSSVMVI